MGPGAEGHAVPAALDGRLPEHWGGSASAGPSVAGDQRGAPFQVGVARPRDGQVAGCEGGLEDPRPHRLAARHPAVSHWPSLEAPRRPAAAGSPGPGGFGCES